MKRLSSVIALALALAAVTCVHAADTGTFLSAPPTTLRVGGSDSAGVRLQLSGGPSTDTLDVTCTPSGGVSVLDAVATASAGTGAAISIKQPRLGINFIIATQGIFPPRPDSRRRLLSLVDGEVHSTEAATTEGAAHEWRTFSLQPYLGEIEMFAGSFPPKNWAFCDGAILQISENSALFALLGTQYGGDGMTTFGLPDLRGRTPIHPPSDGIGFGAQYGAESVTLTQLPRHSHTTSTGSATTTDGVVTHSLDVRTPSLAISMQIALEGIFPSQNRRLLQQNNIARITMFAGNFAIRGSTNCEGQPLAIVQNEALFSLLDTRYGGDGQTTFQVPDLRGRVPIHQGYGAGLPPFAIGETTGETAIAVPLTVTAANLPSHSHSAGTDGVGSISPSGAGTPLSLKQPSVVVNYIISLQGVYPSSSRRRLLSVDEAANSTHAKSASHHAEYHTMADTDPFIGQIQMVAQNFAPRGWALCNGQLLPINQNPALFALLGTTYGGNGQTTFALPDFQGRIPVGAGAGPGLEFVALGQKDGTYSKSLIEAELPSHTHRQVSTKPAASQTPARLAIDAVNQFLFALRATSPTATSGECTAALTTTNANYVLPGATPGVFTFTITHTPVAAAKSYTVDADTALVVSVSDGVIGSSPLTVDPDVGDTLKVILVSGPPSGSSIAVQNSGGFTYTPKAGYTGTDSFMFKINDGTSDSNIATATITVKAKPFLVAAPGFVAFGTDAKLIATPGKPTVANTILKVQCVNGYVQCNTETFPTGALLGCSPSPHECSVTLPVGTGSSPIAYRAPSRSAEFPVISDTCTYTLSGIGATGVTAPIASTIRIGTPSALYNTLPLTCAAAGTVTGMLTPEWQPAVDLQLTATCILGTVASVTLPANSVAPVSIVYTAPNGGSSGADTCTYALSSASDLGLTAQRYLVPAASRILVGSGLRTFTFRSIEWLAGGVSSGGVREFKVSPSVASDSSLTLTLQCRRSGSVLVDVATFTWTAGSLASKMGIYTAPVQCGTDACAWKVTSTNAAEATKYAPPSGWTAIPVGAPANARDQWRQAIKARLDGY